MRMWIENALVVNPGGSGGRLDVCIEEGHISRMVPHGSENPQDAVCRETSVRIDAEGLVLVPGIVDMHVHLREPGHEYKETIESGCRAAAAGGVSAICPMPNTRPVNDNAQVTSFVLQRAKEANGVEVYPVGAISKGLKGIELAEMADMQQAGIVAVTDDGRPVSNSLMMRRAMEYACSLGLLVISHCEDLDLAAGGCMNEGPVATRLGLSGIPNAAETVMVLRDIALAELTGARVHIAHVSTRESVQAIREAKARGVAITCETAPHYFTLSEDAVEAYDTHAKMNPPLRSRADVEAVRMGLSDRTIDVIATDHAPHSSVEKDVEFDKAAFGIIGLETLVPLSLKLVSDGVLGWNDLVEKWSIHPARLIGIDRGLREGAPATLTLIDPNREWVLDPSALQSKSRNTPFAFWNLCGKAVLTMVGGRTVFSERNLS
uniref:Dihydroorotase n=1 Tax=Desulfatirhabdium butyrativorans TaxID=340467 RepID=A0A7C4MNK9_9BACT